MQTGNLQDANRKTHSPLPPVSVYCPLLEGLIGNQLAKEKYDLKSESWFQHHKTLYRKLCLELRNNSLLNGTCGKSGSIKICWKTNA